MHTQRNGTRRWSLALICLAAFGAASFGEDALRQLRVGDTMPAFSLSETNGTTFQYGSGSARVLGLVVLQAGETHLDRLLTDLEDVIKKLRAQGTSFDCVAVMSGPGATAYLQSRSAAARNALPGLADPDFAFWGKLGAIATPTAVVVGADHKIQWIKAGYGYDFVAGFHAQLAKALGLTGSADATVRVQTLENDSSLARRDRQLQLARMLAQKGRLEPALQELEKLHRLDPNAVDVALEFGEVLCRTGRNAEALKLAAGIKAESRQDKARALLIRAWAERQMGQFTAAETLLMQARPLDPESARISYELGKVYEASGDTMKALASYRKALAQVFGDAEVTDVSHK